MSFFWGDFVDYHKHIYIYYIYIYINACHRYCTEILLGASDLDIQNLSPIDEIWCLQS